MKRKEIAKTQLRQIRQLRVFGQGHRAKARRSCRVLQKGLLLCGTFVCPGKMVDWLLLSLTSMTSRLLGKPLMFDSLSLLRPATTMD